jgi:excinuclease UvrABC ATPase subunit
VSAQQIIEEFKHLPRAERAQVAKFVVESEMAEEIQEFERAFAGGHDRPETEEEIQRIETAVKTARNR